MCARLAAITTFTQIRRAHKYQWVRWCSHSHARLVTPANQKRQRKTKDVVGTTFYRYFIYGWKEYIYHVQCNKFSHWTAWRCIAAEKKKELEKEGEEKREREIEWMRFFPLLAKYGIYTYIYIYMYVYIFVHQIAIENVKLYDVLNLTSKHFKYAKFLPSPTHQQQKQTEQNLFESLVYRGS